MALASQERSYHIAPHFKQTTSLRGFRKASAWEYEEARGHVVENICDYLKKTKRAIQFCFKVS